MNYRLLDWEGMPIDKADCSRRIGSTSSYPRAYCSLGAEYGDEVFTEEQAQEVIESTPGLSFSPRTTIGDVLRTLTEWQLCEAI